MPKFTTLSDTYQNILNENEREDDFLFNEGKFRIEPTFRWVAGNPSEGITLDAVVTLSELKDDYYSELKTAVLKIQSEVHSKEDMFNHNFLPLKELVISAIENKVKRELSSIDVEMFIDAERFDEQIKSYNAYFPMIISDIMAEEKEIEV